MTRILLHAATDVARHLRAWHRAAPLRTWLCLLAIAVNFGYALTYRIVPSVDARKFHEIAVNLVTKHTFCFQCDVPLPLDTAIRDIGPGYQFFLADVYSIFGIHPWIVWLLQALMHAVVIAWLWRLMGLALEGLTENRWARLLPLSLYAVHPDIVQSNAMLMADGLFTFLFVGAIVLFLPYLKKAVPHGLRRPAALGLLLGALTMVRPTGMPLFLALMIVLLWRRVWKAALVLACCFALIQTPWAIRNALTYDHFVYNSVVGGLDIWVGMDPEGPGEFNLDKLPHITEQIKDIPPDELDHFAMTQAKKIVREHPLFALQRTVSKFFKLFSLTKTSGFWSHYFGAKDQMATVALSILFNLALLAMGFAGIVYGVMKRVIDRPLLWVSLLAILALSAAPTISVVINRYRIPMLPFFTILAAFWLTTARGKRERLITLSAALGFLALCVGVDLWGSVDKVRERLKFLL